MLSLSQQPLWCHFYAWCVINGAIAFAPEFILQQTTDGCPRAAAQPGHQTWIIFVQPFRLETFSPSSPFPSDPTLLVRRVLPQQNQPLQGIQQSDPKMHDFLTCNRALVACVHETKLGVEFSLKEFTDNAITRCDCPHEGGGGLVTLVYHSIPFTGAWWWHITQRCNGRSSVVCDRPREEGRRHWPLLIFGPFQHGFKSSHTSTSALLLISARVVSGINQRMPPSRMITIAWPCQSSSIRSLAAFLLRWSTAPDSNTNWLDG